MELFFSIKFVGGKALISDLSNVELKLGGINKELAEAKKKGDSDTYKKLRVEQEHLKKTAQELRQEIKNTTIEFQKAKYPTDSLIGLEHQYAKLSKEIREMGAEARKSAEGLKKINQAGQIKSQIDIVNRSMGNFKSTIGNYKTALLGVGDLVTGGLVTGGILALGNALVSSIKKFKEAAKEAEVAKTALTNAFEGDTLKTEAVLQSLEAFAARTPFAFDQITDSFLKLVNRGFQPTIDEMTQIGDLASAQKKSFDQLVEAILDAQVGEFERLKEFGIKARVVGDQVRLSFKGQTIEVERTEDAIRNAIIQFGKLDGVAGSLATQADTLAGIESNLGDSFNHLFRVLGAGINETLKPLASSLAKVVEGLAANIDETEKASAQALILQTQFNAEIEVLKAGNFTQAERSRIIGELNTKYAAYGFNLDQEKASLEDIAEAQKLVNAEFTKRILLLSFQEQITELGKKAQDQADKAIQSQQNLTKITLQNKGLIQETEKERQLREAGLGNIVNQQRDAALKFNIGFREESLKNTQAVQGEITNLTNATDELFKQMGTSLEKMQSEFGSLGDSQSKVKDKVKETTEEIIAQDGSIEFLRNEISRLNDEVERSSDAKFQEETLKQVTLLEKKLKDAEKALDDLKKSLVDKPAIKFFGDVQDPGAPPLSDKEEEALKELLAKQKQAIKDKEKAEEDAREKKKEEEKELGEYLLKKDAENKEKQKEAEEKLQEEIKQLKKDAIFEATNLIANAIFQIEANRIQREHDLEIEGLDNLYEKKIELASGNATFQEGLQKELEKKKEEADRRAFEEDKRRRIAQAVISGLTAAIQSLANTVLPFPSSLIAPGIVGLTTGLQIAQIKSETYEFGGFTGPPRGLFRDKKGKHIVGGVHANEYVGPEFQVKKYPVLFDWLEQDRKRTLRGFELGGYTSIPQLAPINNIFQSNNSNPISQDQLMAMADLIGRQVFQAALEGTMIGAKEGTYQGNNEDKRLRERELSSKTNATF